VWQSPLLGDASLRFSDEPPSSTVAIKQGEVIIRRTTRPSQPVAASPAAGLRQVQVDRSELETLVLRGCRRALEVLAPAGKPELAGKPVRAPHGRLRWHGGQRLVLLEGTPEQIGSAHGRLLQREAVKCMDSVLYLVGLVETVRSGTWSLNRLREAFARLRPHIPPDHLAETDALADAIGISREYAHLGNIFPALFHCSGFAVFGKATARGTLYHGRVLDYMTQIGLQAAAATFVVKPKGKIAFVNVGYAGFIGSVTGMNARQVALGEMGGGGAGKWDGVPMATLMRRALEECESLKEVETLWQESPRTCEYYYVFSDAKIPNAVGVVAVPESVEFIRPGQDHERLGEGIEDAVLLSSGSRLKTLRSRVQDKYGEIDVDDAIELMSRPVCMSSNLHNALLIPGEGRLFVAHAGHKKIAAERPYVEYDFAALLDEFPLDPDDAP